MTTPNKRMPPKQARKQHSMWLMLGGAVMLSLAGFAVIAEQSQAAQDQVNASALQVVDLPTPLTADARTSASRPSTAQAPSTNNLRHVTRPVMRSRSSN